MIRCPVEKEYGVKPCDIVRDVRGNTVIEICVVCLKAAMIVKGKDKCKPTDERSQGATRHANDSV